ncbi:efflux RND transporter permease subunit [Aquibaculum sediminis]|uniref:efflux RND transporter permease subunit n=1 Tax=Aquibaculum sediminis TaxID=3231907 RepID=UPI00345379B6
MNLPEVSVRRHVLAVMLSAVIVLFGAISMRSIGVDRMPDVDMPVISVSTSYSGADAQIVDSSISEPMERGVNAVPGIRNIRSISVPGASIVTITFELGKDIDVAFNEVQARVSRLSTLPEDANNPVIEKVNSASQPVLWLSLTGDWTLRDLDTYARQVIRPQIRSVTGVGEVQYGGGEIRNIRVEVDPAKLAAHNVTVTELISALREEHVMMAGGFLEAGQREEQIQLDLEFHDPVALLDLLVAEREGALITLGDVARVVDGTADRRRHSLFNGEPTVGLGVVKIPGSNTAAIAAEIRERVETRIAPALPPGIELSVAYDESVFIQEQVEGLFLTIFLGVVLTALMIWFFLKNLRSTLIVSLSIPISLMASVAVIYFFGYTLNSVTMLAMLLLIGIVVDDAIVVLENIYRHRESEGRGAWDGAIAGSDEVFMAVIATSLALVSIFVSVLFLDAIIGRFFESFAVVVTFGILASSLVALTLVPMLCSRFLEVRKEHGPVYRALERIQSGMENSYRRLLALTLKARLPVLVLVALALALAFWPLRNIDAEFTPREDTGQFTVSVQAPLGSSLDYTATRLALVDELLQEDEAVSTTFSALGLGRDGQVSSGVVFVTLTDRDERDASQQEIMERLQPRLDQLAGVRAFASDIPFLGGERGEPLQFVLTGDDLDRVNELSSELLTRLEGEEALSSVDLELELDLPQISLVIDRHRARSLGLSAQQIGDTTNALMGGVNVARYNDWPGDGQRYNLRVKAIDGTFEGPEDINKIYLRADSGDLVRLDNVAHFERRTGPAVIARYGMNYAAEFFATPATGLGEAIERVEAHAADLLPLGYNLELVGEAEELRQTADAMLFVLLLAVALVYMVLASQFNSLIQPFFIMAAQPVALVGGVVGIWIGGYSLNIYSMIGLLLLMGLVTKNGILLVDLTNQYREKRDMGVDEALLAACPLRFRPVIMTSMTLVLAMVPAVLGLGAGADTTAPMAAAIIGGMITSMILTLVVIPALYSLVERPRARRRARARAAKA